MRRRTFVIAVAAAAGSAALAGFAGLAGIRWLRRGTRARDELLTAAYYGNATPLAEVRDTDAFDVCIVGSGPAGVVLGTQTAKAGLRTLIVEGGVGPGGDPRYAGLALAEVSGDANYPLVATRVLTPGGTTAIWGGVTPRLHPIDFQVNAYTPDGASWPIDYEAVEPYYVRAERTLRVRGDAQAYGLPRSHPLPIEDKAGNVLAKQMLARLGISSVNTFRSTGPDGGPVRAGRDLLPEFVALAPATLVVGASARHFLSEDGETVRGVLVQDISGSPRTLKARVYVLAAGAVESARRLLLSRSGKHPNGIGNDFDQVGRRFGDHLTLEIQGSVDAWAADDEQIYQIVRSYEFYKAFKREGLGSVTLLLTVRRRDKEARVAALNVAAEIELYPDAGNRVTLSTRQEDLHGDPAAHLHFSFSPRDRATFSRTRALMDDIARQLGASGMQPLPISAEHWGHHHFGTVAMGSDPHTSVVDANLRVHGTQNLFVVSSGNFVTAGAVNPTLLIVALAHRLADHLLGEFGARRPQR